MLPGPDIPPQTRRSSQSSPAMKEPDHTKPTDQPGELFVPPQSPSTLTPDDQITSPKNVITPSSPEPTVTQPAEIDPSPLTTHPESNSKKIPLALRNLQSYNTPGLQEETVTSSPAKRVTRQSKKQ